MTSQVDVIVKTILSYLRDSGQLDLLSGVVDGLLHSSQYQNSKNHVTVTSAVALGALELKQIHAYLHKSIGDIYELVEAIDPGLVAGFTLQVNDTFIDASVLGKINTVSNILTAKE